jgi:hypothetical protein
MVDRDLTQFPLDDNGEVLWRMASHGDKLHLPRDMDFSVVFPSEHQAEASRVFMGGRGFKTALRRFTAQPDGLTWDVTVTQPLTPTHSIISAFELMLEEEGAIGGGVNDS